MGRVLRIFTCPMKGLPMEEVASAEARKGVGLAGDRYATGNGAYSNAKPPKIRHLTLIAIEAIVVANQSRERPIEPHETRRNILTAGVDLNALVGREFQIGSVRVRGTELCEPCERPSNLVGTKGFTRDFAGYGGLRVEVLDDGVINRHDPILGVREAAA